MAVVHQPSETGHCLTEERKRRRQREERERERERASRVKGGECESNSSFLPSFLPSETLLGNISKVLEYSFMEV